MSGCNFDLILSVRDLRSGESLYIPAIDIPKYKNDFRFKADPNICFVKGVVTHIRPSGNQAILRFVDFDNRTMDVFLTFVNSNCYINCPSFAKVLKKDDVLSCYPPIDFDSFPSSNYNSLSPAPPMRLNYMSTEKYNASTSMMEDVDLGDLKFEIIDNPVTSLLDNYLATLDSEASIVDENANFFDTRALNIKEK